MMKILRKSDVDFIRERLLFLYKNELDRTGAYDVADFETIDRNFTAILEICKKIGGQDMVFDILKQV